MKITGTKKLLIIFFALVCALAAGLGVIIARSGVSVRASSAAQSEVQLVPPDSSDSIKESADYIAADDAADNALAEEEYDERFDEDAIRGIADILNIEYDLVNLYCHVVDVDARELYAVLLEDWANALAAEDNSAVIDYDRDRDGVLSQEQIDAMQSTVNSDAGQIISDISDDIALFAEAYVDGVVEVSEEDTEKEWFVSPDEVSSYAGAVITPKLMIDYRHNSNYGIVKIYVEETPTTIKNGQTSTTLTANGSTVDGKWVDVTNSIIADSNLHIPSTADHTVRGTINDYGFYYNQMSSTAATAVHVDYVNGYGTQQSLTSGIWNYHMTACYQCGYEYTITLEPGQRLLLTYLMSTTYARYAGYGAGYDENMTGYTSEAKSASNHYEKMIWYAGSTSNTGKTSLIWVDGDAPTGTVYLISKTGTAGNYTNTGYLYFTTWNTALGNGKTTTTISTAYKNKSSQSWSYWVKVNRANSPQPTIVQDDANATYTSTNKTSYYYGSPVTLSVCPDYGSTLLKWSAYTNSSCTIVDSTVELYSRSDHGVESTSDPACLVVQSSAAGTHYIKLESTTGRWADGSTAPVVFSLTIKEQYVSRPYLKGESGVSGKEKTVYYTGDFQTITFENCDPAYVGYSAPGMYEESWDNNTLVLQQKEQGTYSITLYLKNPAGCFWSDTKTNESLTGYKLNIKEMLIAKPTVPTDGWPKGSTHTVNECVVDYNGEAKLLKISPAREEQLVIIAAGLQAPEFVDEDDDGIAETCIFKMTDAGTQTITIMPDSGYLWTDKTKTAISFKITINATPVDFPVLAPGQGQKNNTIETVYNPATVYDSAGEAISGYTTMVINNIPKDAIAISTAMRELSWVPSDPSITDDDQLGDFYRDVLTLYASEATKYVVTFSLTSTNYRWKNSGTPPQFTLIISPYSLNLPFINETLPDGYTGGTIEGDTKTIYYNTTENIGQSVTPIEDRYFKLFVGGFTGDHVGFDSKNGQITIKYSKTGLNEDWTDIVNNDYRLSTANLTLEAYEAGNYLIDITPTHNYQWVDGTNDMYTFKFVVTPVYHDMLSMFFQYGDNLGYVPVGTTSVEADFNTEEKQFRIGSTTIATEYFIPPSSNEEGMSYTLVDEDHKEIAAPVGFYIKVVNYGVDSNGIAINVLEGGVVNAGVYIIKVSLNSVNYAWRDGTTDNNRDVYYTITVKPQSVGTPKINPDEGSGGQNRVVHDETYLNYVEAGYDSGDIQMVIEVDCGSIKISNIVTIIFDPDGNDADPTTDSGYGIWIDENWSEDYETEINRLIFAAKNVGYHKVILKINDPNYIWGNDSDEILFRIEIAYAQVDDIIFYYNANDEDIVLIGGNNAMASESYDFDVMHHITVARSNDEFAKTPFDDMFTFEISYNNPGYPLKASAYANSAAISKSDVNNCLVLDFVDANVYHINIYLTSNYRWKSIQQIGAEMTLTFTVRSKIVGIPNIIDEGEKNADGTPAATIVGRDKTVTYDTNTIQSIAINFGDDYRAFMVDDNLTTTFLELDRTILDSKMVRYTARSAGPYYVYITLTDTNNYSWTGGLNVIYTLNILPRSVSVPDAFYTFYGKAQGGIESAQYDYLDVKSGTSGTLITADANGVYKTTHDYSGQWQYVFLFGYAIENQEVEISVAPSDDPNIPDQGGYFNQYFSAGGLVRGHYIYAKYVNVYTITVEFKINEEFGTPNCHWSGVSYGTDYLPREFIFEIEKLGVEVPELDVTADAFNSTVPVFVNNSDNKVEWHFEYTGNSGDIVLGVNKCLSDDKNTVWFMDYSDHQASLIDTRLDVTNSHLTITIIGKAEVSVTYRLAVKLDYLNEYWIDSGVPDDIEDKEIYIVIDRKGIDAPTILKENDEYLGVYPIPGGGVIPSGLAIYSADGLSKMYSYDAAKTWLNAMTITGIESGKLNYTLSGTNMSVSSGVDTTTGLLFAKVGTSESDSGTYSIIFELADTRNYKWSGTTDDTTSIKFDLIIDPIRIAKPVIDQNNSVYNSTLDPTPFIDDANMEVTFWKDTNNHGILQYIVINNYVDKSDIMSYEIVKAFEDAAGTDGKIILGGGTDINALKLGSANAGTYQVTIKPTKNIAWDDGTNGDITFTLTINKYVYADPTVYDPGLMLPVPTPTVVQTTTGYQRTVTYILNTWQSLSVIGYDETIMKEAGTTSSIDESVVDYALVKTGDGKTTGTYEYQGKLAGTYTVKFSLVQPDNERFAYADADSITITFVIEKLQLEKPLFDSDADVLLTDESVNGAADTFTAVYDANYHGALVLNVLDENYMTYLPDDDYQGKFSFAAVPTATTALTPAPSATYMTINDVFNTATKSTKFNGSFINTLMGISNPIDRENFILLDAKETGTYKLTFTLKDTANVEWVDGTDGTVTVTFVVTKKKLAAPSYNGATSQAYTGQAITFELKDIYGLMADAFTPVAYTGLEYEVFEIVSTPTAKATITAESLDITTNILKISATEIGSYTIRIKIKETDHVEWISTSDTEKLFSFTITKSSISPTIEFINPLLSDGVTVDATTDAEFLANNFEWPKSSIVTAKVTFPKLSVNASGYIDIDESFGLDIYYVNLSDSTVKLCLESLTPSVDAADLFAAAVATLPVGPMTSALNSKWSLIVTDTNPGGTPEYQYDLVYTFTIIADSQVHPEDENHVRYIPMGNYSMHVDQSGTSTTYVVGSVSKNFEILADRAPFETNSVFDNIVWQRYLVSDPDTILATYSVGATGNVLLADGVTLLDHWTNMTAADEIVLPFLDNNESYGFKLGLDATGMNSETDVQLALQSWEVNWDGNYGGTSTAKYAGSYSVSVTISAKDAKAFSFTTTTYTLYYKISKILYDLNGLAWYYTDETTGADTAYPNDGTTPFTYDGKTHTVRLDASASVWANLPGLTVLYDVDDLNSQVSAKYDSTDPTDDTKNYKTTVRFVTSNPNYELPDFNDPNSYMVNGVKGGAFDWSLIWGIEKATIKDGWISEKSSDGSTTLTVPKLFDNDDKVEYTYYLDDGSGTVITEFNLTATPTNFFVVATLISDPDHPELDYANNYLLVVDGTVSNPAITADPSNVISVAGTQYDNARRFQLSANGNISLTVTIKTPDPSDPTRQISNTLTGSKLDTDPTSNVFYYDGVTTFEANVTVDAPYNGIITVISNTNPNGHLLVTYYNTSNTLRPIAAPTDPGHYLVKIKLVDFPADGTDYGLAETEYYFDVNKGVFDADKIYWQYNHTDDNGNTVYAKFDVNQGVNGLWIVDKVLDSAGNDISATQTDYVIGAQISFTYDGRDHNVNLVCEDTRLGILTNNNSYINAGKFTKADNTASVAKLSYDGKYWEAPTIDTTMEWEIEKAVITLSTNWYNVTNTAYNSTDYVYTISGGKEVKYYVTLGDVPELLKTFVTYKTYDLDHLDADGNPTLLDSNSVSKAGNYRTDFSCEDFLDDETLKANYVLSNPADANQSQVWCIAQREISLPYSNLTWTAFDGYSHDLIDSLTILSTWEEYLTVAFEYDNGTGFVDYDGTGEFGNVRFASHAGIYKYVFSIIEDINTFDKDNPLNNQINVVFSLGGLNTSTDDQSVNITIAKATMYGNSWNANNEASTVILTGSTYTSDDVIDYRFTLPDGVTDVPVEDVAASSNTPYIIWAFVKDEFANDVELFTNPSDTSSPHWSFTTATLSDNVSDQFEVEKIPYIIGYKENGVEHDFTYEEWKQLMIDTPGFFTDEQLAAIDDGTFDWVPYLGYESPEAEQAAYDAMTDDEKAAYDAMSDADKEKAKKEAAIQVALYKSKTRVNLTYNGNTIEFVISNWSYYSQYLDIWQGNLVRSEAGDYSVTLVFQKTSPAPALCWGFEDTDGDGIIDGVDRSPVKLEFRISFRMLTIPTIKDPTYTGNEINVLTSSLGDEGYDKWWSEVQEYVDIIGATGTLAGGYTLQLKIKDLYLNTIHWDNGTAKGQPGTFTVKWNVLPIYIAIPTLDTSKKITYSGSAHSVFELFTGYNNGDLSKDLQSLMQLANISGERGINAGTYEARFMLPDANYAWKTDTGDVNDSTLIQFPWTIQRKSLDMSNLEWNYDENDPFQYTIENGDVQSHTIELKGLPEELEDYVTYLTDGVIGNEKSLMGTYNTVVYFMQGNIDMTNYELTNEPSDFLDKYKDSEGGGYVAITWDIVERRFNIPDENTVVSFDGTVRDILSLFGFDEGWDNYLDITVEYKPLGAASTEYQSYEDIATADSLLGYSPFNVFYLGDYRIEFTIKSGLNDETTCVVWMDGGNKLTTKQMAVLTINPLELIITDWQLDSKGENYVIVSSEYDKLSEESREVFEYIIRDEATGEVVTMDDVVKRGAGIEYTIEFAIKEGNDYAISKGIKIGVNGTTNPYGFNSLDFVDFPGNPNAQGSVIYWLPDPTIQMVSANNVFDGTDKIWQIENWDSNYLFENVYPNFLSDMMNNHGVDLDGYVSFIVPDSKDSSYVDTNEGTITLKAAGNYEIVMRLLPNVNLSWYDPTQYTFNGTNLYALSAPTTPITGTALDALIDRKAKKLEIEIEKASVDRITDDILESLKLMIPVLEYTGKEYDLTQLTETKAFFDRLKVKYGELITFEGYKATNAGDYTLLIKLTDPNSSFWNLMESETVQVNDKSFAEYDPSYSLKYVGGVIKYVNEEGTEYNNGNYSLTVAYKMTKAIAAYVGIEGILDENGIPEAESGAKYVVDENGKAVRYSLIDGNYVEDSEGAFVAKYSLMPDGSIVEKPEMADGKQVIDQDNSIVTITRIKTSTDPYEISWSISSSAKSAPTVDPDVKIVYTGSEQFAEKALLGFDATVMEIVEGGSGLNVGEYTAKIRIKDDNYMWRDGIADEDGFVYVTWKIEKTSIDLSYVTWKFTDGTNDYADGLGMTYTRVGGKPVVFWAELDNLPEAVRSSIRYTTNGVVGAYAGTNAGKYITSFEIIDPYGNFESIIIPETLATSVTWNIQRRLLEIPSVNTTYMIFDDEPHDLLAMLDLQDDWEEYFTITVMYAKNFTAFDAYLGHDGNPYEAYGAGAYRFIFNIKAGINPVCSDKNHTCGIGKTCEVLACVGWLKSSGEIIIPDDSETTEKAPEIVEDDVVTDIPEAPVALTVENTVREAVQVAAAEVTADSVADVASSEKVTVDTAARQICDRLRKLTYGAEIQLHSFRKYLR